MKRFERVNLFNRPQNFDGFAEPLTRAKNDIERLDMTRNKSSALQHILNDCYLTLLYYHFEISNPEPIKPVSYFIDHGIDCTLQYFYGNWRNEYKQFPYEEPYTEKESRLRTTWNREFYQGSLFSLFKNDKESLLKIAQWIDRDIIAIGAIHPFDYSSHTSITYFSPLFYVFAQYFCGVPREKYAQEIDCITKGTRSVTKALLKVWESIYEKDSKTFEKQIVQMLDKHIKQASKMKPPFDFSPLNIVSQEITLMWNIALRSGMKMPEFPEEIMDRIVTPQSIGLEK
jgi:hypothetical protein